MPGSFELGVLGLKFFILLLPCSCSPPRYSAIGYPREERTRMVAALGCSRFERRIECSWKWLMENLLACLFPRTAAPARRHIRQIQHFGHCPAATGLPTAGD